MSTSKIKRNEAIHFLHIYMEWIIIGYGEFLEIICLNTYERVYKKNFKISKKIIDIQHEEDGLIIVEEKRKIKIDNFRDFIQVKQINNCIEGLENVQKYRIYKRISQNMLLICECNSIFRIKKISEKGELEEIFEGRHCNWVADGVVDKDILYTIGYDGAVRVWNLAKRKCIGIRNIKKGWGLSISLYKQDVVIGDINGRIMFISKDNLKLNQLGGAIWNLYGKDNDIYAVSEGGEIAIRSIGNNKYKKRIRITNGWVNSLSFEKQNIYAVTSYGELIKLDAHLQEKIEINKWNLWLNAIANHKNTLFIVTAEGELIIYNIKDNKYKIKHLSEYQLIDIKYVKDKVIVISVEGEIFVYDMLNDKVKKNRNKFHYTSMAYNSELNQIIVATFEGTILMFDVDNVRTINIIKICYSRLWKIVFDKRNIICISTDKSIYKIESDTGLVLSKKLSEFPTTCNLIKDKLYVGTDKGEIIDVDYNNTISVTEKERYTEKINAAKVIIYYDSTDSYSKIYRERNELILNNMELNYSKIDIAKNERLRTTIIKETGWDRFPIVIFWGTFVCAGSVLAQMYETGTLKRIVLKLEEENK